MALTPEEEAELAALEAQFSGQQQQQPQGFSGMEMMKNIPGSALQYGKDLAYPFLNPIDTAKGIGTLAQGAYQKFTPGVQPAEITIDKMKEFYGDRYGSLDNALQTLQTDPVGLLADLSMVGGVAGKVGKAPRITAGATAIDPVNAAINTLTASGKLLPDTAPGQWWQEAAKINFTKRRPQSKIDEMTQTALNEQIMPTSEGLLKLNQTVSDLNSQIDAAIDAATTAGGTVKKEALFKHLKALRRQMGGPKVNAAQDLQTIDAVVGAFNEHMEKTGKQSMNARELQEFKKDAYTRIDFDRSQGKADMAADETRKAMAKAAKEGVEELVPDVDIAELNRREGGLLGLRESLQRSASRIERRDKVGIGMPIKAMTGATIGDTPGALVGAASGIFDAPKNKARAALGLHRVQQSPLMDVLTTSRMGTRPRQGLLELGQIMQYLEEQGAL